MAVQLISYDLQRPGQDYDGLYDAIKALGSWWHCLESVWLVDTSLAPPQVRSAIQSHLDANDLLMVATLSGNWATRGLSSKCTDWLCEHLGS